MVMQQYSMLLIQECKHTQVLVRTISFMSASYLIYFEFYFLTILFESSFVFSFFLLNKQKKTTTTTTTTK